MAISQITVAIIILSMFLIVFAVPIYRRKQELEALQNICKRHSWELVKRDSGHEIVPERDEDWTVFLTKENPKPQSYREVLYWEAINLTSTSPFFMTRKISSDFLAEMILKSTMLQRPNVFDPSTKVIPFGSKSFRSKYSCWAVDEEILRQTLTDDIQEVLLKYSGRDIHLFRLPNSLEIRQSNKIHIPDIPHMIELGQTILQHTQKNTSH